MRNYHELRSRAVTDELPGVGQLAFAGMQASRAQVVGEGDRAAGLALARGGCGVQGHVHARRVREADPEGRDRKR